MAKYEVNGHFYDDDLGRFEGLSSHEAYVLTGHTNVVFMHFGNFHEKLNKGRTEPYNTISFMIPEIVEEINKSFEKEFNKIMKIQRVKKIHDDVTSNVEE